MRFIGLDIHRDFCEVAIAEGRKVRPAPRVKTDPETLALFADSLGADDQVTLEATGNAGDARIISPHVERVVLADPRRPRQREQTRSRRTKVDDAHARKAARGRLVVGGVAAR